MNDGIRHLNATLSAARARAEDHLGELTDAYSGLLRSAGRAAAGSFRNQTSVIAAVSPWEPPPGDLVDGGSLEQDAQRKLAPIHKRILKAAAPAADLGIAFDVTHATPQALLATIAQRLDTLGQAIRQPVAEAVQQGYEQGWSVARTANEITSKVDAFTPGRASALARTDLNALSNGASVMMARQAGASEKTWLATDDDRTRETHAEADGQTVPLDQPFTVGGEQADYPGDPNLSDEESFNCRCAVTYSDGLTAAGEPDFSDLAMVALFPRQAEADALSVDGGQPAESMHITLLFLGAASDVDVETLQDVVRRVASTSSPLEGTIGGCAVFAEGDNGTPSILLPDVKGLAALQQDIESSLRIAGIESPSEHGFLPHLTLAYLAEPSVPDTSALGSPLHFDSISIDVGTERLDFPLNPAITAGGDMNTNDLTAAASGDTDLPLSDRDRAWNAGEATARLKKWASSDGSGDADKIDFGKLSRGYFSRAKAADDGAAIGDLKLPFADIVNSKLTAIWRGVTAGAQRLSSTDIPDAEKKAIQTRMGAYYEKASKQFDDDTIKVPWGVTASAFDLDEMGADDLWALAERAKARAEEVERMTLVLTDIELTAAVDGGPTRFRATLLVEGEVTEDGRLLLPGSTSWRQLPLTLGLMLETPHSTETLAPTCGRMDMIWRAGNAIQASGEFTDNSDDPDLATTGRQAVSAIKDKFVNGISVDLAVIDGEVVFFPDVLDLDGEDELPAEVDENLADPSIGGQDVVIVDDDPPGRYVWCIKEGVIGSACVVPFPAIAQATIEVITASGGVQIIRAQRPLFHQDVITASVAPLEPPREWFNDPKLNGPTPITVTDEGRVFGHVALWSGCHTGFTGRCVPPPRSRTGYSHFHDTGGRIKLADGSLLPIGKITLKSGHASTVGNIGEAAARSHYDNTASVAAFVRAGEDKTGIWVSGSLKSDLPRETVRDLLANPLSGDWRNGEMIAAHAVPTPGFPILQASAIGPDGEEQSALIITTLIPAIEEDQEPRGALSYLRPGRRKDAA